MEKIFKYLCITLCLLLLSATGARSQGYRIAWSHYTGWEPWAYIEESGILAKWAEKYEIDDIEIVLVDDYLQSINMYTAGQFDGCVMTNMDALTIPAVAGVDSTVLIIGGFSGGNDGIVLLNGTSVYDLKGRKLRLVELSVSHYLLSRALSIHGMSERDLTLVNSSDADIVEQFAADAQRDPEAAVCTWNPMLMRARKVEGANLVFDSSQIPGEIIDCLVVRTDADDRLKRALAGAWYEAMEIMSGHCGTRSRALEIMAASAGSSPAEFKAQLKTTRMFYEAAEAASFAAGGRVKATMDYVRTFSFDHGLFGEAAPSRDFVGIQFPDGSIMGDKNNIKLRFDNIYMKIAAGR